MARGDLEIREVRRIGTAFDVIEDERVYPSDHLGLVARINLPFRGKLVLLCNPCGSVIRYTYSSRLCPLP
jgi:hypothetical protein